MAISRALCEPVSVNEFLKLHKGHGNGTTLSFLEATNVCQIYTSQVRISRNPHCETQVEVPSGNDLWWYRNQIIVQTIARPWPRPNPDYCPNDCALKITSDHNNVRSKVTSGQTIVRSISPLKLNCARNSPIIEWLSQWTNLFNFAIYECYSLFAIHFIKIDVCSIKLI